MEVYVGVGEAAVERETEGEAALERDGLPVRGEGDLEYVTSEAALVPEEADVITRSPVPLLATATKSPEPKLTLLHELRLADELVVQE